MCIMKNRSTFSGFKPVALAATGFLLFIPSPSFAQTSGSAYWHGFKKFWLQLAGQQNGVVMATLVVGAISLFIITRGKWRK
jgi:threonine/homoserine/homoserine lactone efflux protein